jgi:hypothetical protein
LKKDVVWGEDVPQGKDVAPCKKCVLEENTFMK